MEDLLLHNVLDPRHHRHSRHLYSRQVSPPTPSPQSGRGSRSEGRVPSWWGCGGGGCTDATPLLHSMPTYTEGVWTLIQPRGKSWKREMSLRCECVWFDQHQYESVEARYQAILANRFLGLKVEVCFQNCTV